MFVLRLLAAALALSQADVAVESGDLGDVEGQPYTFTLHCAGAAERRCDSVKVFERVSQSEPPAMVFERTDSGTRGAQFGRPELVRTMEGLLLYLPTMVDGSTERNASEYYLRVANRWSRIESETWLRELERQIPGGVDIWRGVWPDPRTLKAEAALYRPDDHDCCPTGGRAVIQLAIRDGAFRIDSLAFELSN